MNQLSKNKIKFIQSLHRKKFREQEKLFLVEGEKMALELLQQSRIAVNEIFALESWLENHPLLIKKYHPLITVVTERELKKISTLSTPNKILVIARQPDFFLNKSEVKSNLSLYLDGIRDPGNMGTILRIADWFGIPYLFCSNDCVEVFNPKVVQASMGAIFRVEISVMSFEDLKNEMPELPVYGTVLDGENIYNTALSPNGIIVIGSEAKGISKAVEQRLDKKLTIPSFGKSGAESLNAGVAAGVVCSVFRSRTS